MVMLLFVIRSPPPCTHPTLVATGQRSLQSFYWPVWPPLPSGMTSTQPNEENLSFRRPFSLVSRSPLRECFWCVFECFFVCIWVFFECLRSFLRHNPDEFTFPDDLTPLARQMNTIVQARSKQSANCHTMCPKLPASPESCKTPYLIKRNWLGVNRHTQF